MSLSSLSTATNTAARDGFGVGKVPIYVDPRIVLGFDEGDDEFAAYAERLEAVSSRFTYLSADATGGNVSNTYASVVAQYEALSAADRARPVMVNAEYPWLAILQTEEGGAVSSSWTDGTTYPQVQVEFTRQGLGTVSGSTTLAELQAAAQGLYNDISAELTSQGCPMVVHYASVGLSFSDFAGVPRGGLRASAPANGRSWFSKNPYTIREAIDIEIDGKVIRYLTEAQSDDAVHGAAMYCFVPNSTRFTANIANYTSSQITRKNAAGTTVSPDFHADDLRFWVRDTSRRLIAEYRRAMHKSYANEGLSASLIPTKVCAIVHGFGIPALMGSFINWQHWIGLGMKDVTRTAEDEFAALFTAGDADSPLAGGPDMVMVWHSAKYYFVTIPFLNTNTDNDVQKQTFMVRWAHEVDFFGRPAFTSGEPVGNTNQTTQNTWFQTHQMGDGYWVDDVPWWTVAGGSQLPSPCVLDGTTELAPWLDFTGDIYTSDVKLAIRHCVSEKSTALQETARTTLEGIRR